MEHASFAHAVIAPVPLPPMMDLRAGWWDVGDQDGSGACVGWAIADGPLRWHLVDIGAIAPDDHLSARYLWMASKEMDRTRTPATTFIEKEGTSLKAALDVLRRYGMVKEEVLPFRSGAMYPLDQKTFYAMAAQLKIVSYFNLGLDPDTWKGWLAGHGPIVVRILVDRTFANPDAQGRLDTFFPGTRREGAHAVTLVGYTHDRFIIRNSWGTVIWGDGGFGYASFDYVRAAITEAYGITVSRPPQDIPR